jgi:hypothetical protein
MRPEIERFLAAVKKTAPRARSTPRWTVVSWVGVAAGFSTLILLWSAPSDVCAPVTDVEDHRQCLVGLGRLPAPAAPVKYDPCEPIKDPQQREFCRGHAPEPKVARSRDLCHDAVTDQQRHAAQSLIRAHGYTCDKVDQMCPYIFSEGADVFCNDARYWYGIENHGGIWSVKS